MGTFSIRAVPNASKTEIVGLMEDGSIKVKLHAAPEDGRANKELTSFLAKHFGLPKGAVSLVSGESSRLKRVSIEGLDQWPT